MIDKNNKGFTLVEILAVVVILGILAVIFVLNILGSSQKTKQKMLETKKSTTVSALVLWAQENRKCFIYDASSNSECFIGLNKQNDVEGCVQESDYLKCKVKYGTMASNNLIKFDNKNNKQVINPVDNSSMNDEILELYYDLKTKAFSATPPKEIVTTRKITAKPEMTVNPMKDTAWSSTKTIFIDITSGNDFFKPNGTLSCGWSASQTAEPAYTTINLQYGESDKSISHSILGSGLNGSYFLWLKPNIFTTRDYSFKGDVYGPYNYDNIAPTITLNVENGTTYESIKAANVTISDTVGGGGLSEAPIKIYYRWSTTPISCNDMTSYIIMEPENGSSNITQTITIENKSGSGKLYICNKDEAISDNAGNEVAKGTILSSDMYLDNAAPTMTLNVPNGTTYSKSKTATVTIEDKNGSGLSNTPIKIYYSWNKDSGNCNTMTDYVTLTPKVGDNKITQTITIDNKTGPGTLYICNKDAEIKDRAGNVLDRETITGAIMYLDNEKPKIISTIYNYDSSKTNNAGSQLYAPSILAISSKSGCFERGRFSSNILYTSHLSLNSSHVLSGMLNLQYLK